MKKMTVISLLFCCINTQANEDISYSFLEVCYGYLDYANNLTPDGFYLDGAFDLSDRFYIGGHVDDRRFSDSEFNRYDISFGFHTNGSGKTEFYTDIRIGQLEF